RPERKVLSAFLPLVSCDTLCWKSCFRYACAWRGFFPSRSCDPYAAITSQRAPPELNGFGNTTCTPGFTRSSQVRMCFGLPFRSTKTTTDFETMPLCAFDAHDRSTSFELTSRSMSVDTEKFTTSAGRPAATALL